MLTQDYRLKFLEEVREHEVTRGLLRNTMSFMNKMREQVIGTQKEMNYLRNQVTQITKLAEDLCKDLESERKRNEQHIEDFSKAEAFQVGRES